jgi:hypothetical protein
MGTTQGKKKEEKRKKKLDTHRSTHGRSCPTGSKPPIWLLL